MTDILIFDTYDRKGCKDIVFYTAYSGMVLPLVHFSAYCALILLPVHSMPLMLSGCMAPSPGLSYPLTAFCAAGRVALTAMTRSRGLSSGDIIRKEAGFEGHRVVTGLSPGTKS
jgi:hypothetical protein